MNRDIHTELKDLKAASVALAVDMPGDGIEIEIFRMRLFLARVIRTPLAAIKITGNPATDENTDLLGFYEIEGDEGEDPGAVTIGILCPLRAIEIDNVLEKMQNYGPGSHHFIVQAREVFANYTATRPVLYQ
jgi:hypothetical protein